ncbi:type IA DNA topoisomerase [Macrococcus armenti]|uniref:type IA DNA topoisomerase n=1 Tax=Macrococcus armenti TaxID=2875764 RepID=UPI001CCDEE7B|nr:type IA DNA topoisomerase [Macrococcus armenti]UBH09801.1 DNA topoisomerase III [Macrococcus armenti]
MAKMILCEKPSQANDISNIFQNIERKDGYIKVNDPLVNGTAYIVWAVGHIIELKLPHEYNKKYEDFNNYPILLKTDDFKFKVSEDKRKIFNTIKKVYKDFDISEIIIATDSAREGENIAYKIINFLDIDTNTKISRLWISSTTNESIKKGFKNLLPGKETYNYYVEARTREYSDWLVGINLSRHFTKIATELGNSGVIHIGRVASPTLNLVNIREEKIKNFKSKKYYKVEGKIQKDNSTIKSELKNEFDTEDDLHTFLFENDITDLSQKGIVHDVTKETKYSMPPKFYDLTSLQEDMNDIYKYSAKETLKIAQSLYEKKLITYPRTDSRYITEHELKTLQKMKSYLEGITNVELNNELTNNKLVDDSKVDDHYAILPTGKQFNDSDLNEKEINLLSSIVKNVAMNFMNKEEFEITTVIVAVKSLEFIFTGKVITVPGYKAIENNIKQDNIIPEFTVNEVVDVELDLLEKITKPPKRYTEKTLLKAMANPIEALENEGLKSTLKETKGLGTPATRADIIENLKNNKYIQVQKNKIYITKNGILSCKLLNDHLLSKADMTGIWEQYLKDIGKGKKDDKKFIDTVNSMILKTINTEFESDENLKQLVKQKSDSNNICKCPKCKDGYVTKRKNLYGCTNYKNGCDFTLPNKLLEKNITNKHIKDLCENNMTDEIKGFISKKSGKSFNTRLALDKNYKIAFSFDKRGKK